MKESKAPNQLKESLLMGVFVMITGASVITIMNMF
jgi:hypothetical protein